MDVALFFPALFIGIFGFLAVAVWAGTRHEERKSFYRHELYQQMLQHPGPAADSLRAMLEQQEERKREETVGGIQLGGLITLLVGVGLGIFLYFITEEKPVYLVALIPLLVGAALLFHGYVIGPRSFSRPDQARR